MHIGVDDAVAAVDSARMTAVLRPTPVQILRGYLVLPHAVPVIVVMAATAAFGLIAAGGWPGLSPMLRLLGAMFGAQIAIGAANELIDAGLDAVAKPEKPIPSGLVSRAGARIVAVSGAVAMAVLSLTFGLASFLLCALGTVVGVAYSLWFKRTIWSWIPYLVALPLLPIWVWTALDSVDPGLYAIYPIGAAAVIAVQIAQSLPDIEADRTSDIRTLAVVLGAERAQKACWLGITLAAVMASLLAPWTTDDPGWIWTGAVSALALVGVNILTWSRDRRRGGLTAFPYIAIAATVLGLAWTISVISR